MSQVPGLGHVTFYRQRGRYPTLFHCCWSLSTGFVKFLVLYFFKKMEKGDLFSSSVNFYERKEF
jgi:hypothetical protein